MANNFSVSLQWLLIAINLVKMLVIYSIGRKIIFSHVIIMAMTTDFFSPVFTPYSACLFTQTEGKDKFAEKWRRADENAMKWKTFFRRMHALSLKRMFRLIRAVSRESHRPRLLILIDMLWCVVRYGIGYLDYKVFGFAFIHGEARKTFMTMDDNLSLVRAVNDKAYTYLFDQKCAFNERFHRFLGREWLDLRTTSMRCITCCAGAGNISWRRQSGSTRRWSGCTRARSIRCGWLPYWLMRNHM